MQYTVSEDIAKVMAWQCAQAMRRLGEATLSEARNNRARLNELLPISEDERGALSFLEVETSVGSVPVMVVRTAQSSSRHIMLYVHGGGWSVGQAKDYAALAIALAKASGYTIIVPDYALAPEYPFPYGLNQISALLQRLQGDAVVLGAETAVAKKIVLVGDSSGGNMCAVLGLEAARRGQPVDAQLLIYPAVDIADDLVNAAEDMPALSGTAFRWFVDMYAPNESDRKNPRASPARDPDLQLSPPTVIVTAEHDILNGLIDCYEASLRAAAVPVRHHRMPETIHTFIQLPGLVGSADKAIALVMQDLREILSD